MAFGWDDVLLGGLGLFGTLFGAKKQADSSAEAAKVVADSQKYAADLQAKGNADTLAFTKGQAQNAFLNSEAARAGNYGMYAAAQRRLGAVGDLIGAGPREIPAYVPGVDPHFDGGAASATPVGSGATPAASAATADTLKALLDAGMDPQQAVAQFNKQYGRTTGNEAVYYDPSQHGGIATIGLPGAYLAKPGASWDITQRSGGGAAAAPKLGSVASYLQSTPTPYAPVPIARSLQMPGSVASYLNG